MSGRNSKRRRTSPVWDYFRRQDGKITCSICNKDFPDGRGTSNLQKHLRAKHVDEAKKCFGEADAKQPLMSMFTDARRCSPARATRITELIAEMVARDLVWSRETAFASWLTTLNRTTGYLQGPTFEASVKNCTLQRRRTCW